MSGPNRVWVDGPISIPVYGPEETDADGQLYRPVTGYVSGEHYNVARVKMAPLVSYQISQPDPEGEQIRARIETVNPLGEFEIDTPATPTRNWKGADTAFLKFTDKQTAISALQGAGLWVEFE